MSMSDFSESLVREVTVEEASAPNTSSALQGRQFEVWKVMAEKPVASISSTVM